MALVGRRHRPASRNGLGVVVARVDPLIVTLAMLSILQGIIFLYTDRTVGSAPDEFRELAYGSVGPVPIPALAPRDARHRLLGRARRRRRSDATSTPSAATPRRAPCGHPGSTGCVSARTSSAASSRPSPACCSRRAWGPGYTGAGAGFELAASSRSCSAGTALSGGRGGVAGTIAGVFLLAIIANDAQPAGHLALRAAGHQWRRHHRRGRRLHLRAAASHDRHRPRAAGCGGGSGSASR